MICSTSFQTWKWKNFDCTSEALEHTPMTFSFSVSLIIQARWGPLLMYTGNWLIRSRRAYYCMQTCITMMSQKNSGFSSIANDCIFANLSISSLASSDDDPKGRAHSWVWEPNAVTCSGSYAHVSAHPWILYSVSISFQLQSCLPSHIPISLSFMASIWDEQLKSFRLANNERMWQISFLFCFASFLLLHAGMFSSSLASLLKWSWHISFSSTNSLLLLALTSLNRSFELVDTKKNARKKKNTKTTKPTQKKETTTNDCISGATKDDLSRFFGQQTHFQAWFTWWWITHDEHDELEWQLNQGLRCEQRSFRGSSQSGS